MPLRKDLFINNQWKTSQGSLLISRNPATQEILWQGYTATDDAVQEAIKAAKEAFPSWAALSFEERVVYLERFHQLLLKHADEIAETISKEVGKPLWESKLEVNSILTKVTLSEEAYKMRSLPATHTTKYGQGITRYKPHGVLAVLGPFNFPGHLPMGHIIPALLAGNTVVFKPSEQAPLVAERLMTLLESAEFPPGVVNLVQGARDTGRYLISHEDVNGVLFTGSWETGRIISELFAKRPDKLLVLEMGGNNPLVVTDVDDLQNAAAVTIYSAYLTAGQRCSCARRLIVPKGEKGDLFLDTLVTEIKKIKVGRYDESPEPFMGPVIDESTARHLLAVQETLKLKGGISLLPLKLLQINSALLSPGLIDVTAVAYRPDEEFFGPLLQVIRVDDFDAALVEANKTSYGLTAGLLSNDKSEYERFYREVHAGVINWNVPTTDASGAAPFGGIKHSGNLRPSGFFAVDYCSYPVASTESETLVPPPSFTKDKETPETPTTAEQGQQE